MIPPKDPAKEEAEALAAEGDEARLDLALLQSELALERTQLAWVRTAFTFMTAGLALDQGMAALHAARVLAGTNWVEGGHVGGVMLTILATLALTLATTDYRNQAQELARLQTRIRARIPPVLPLSVLVILLGVGLVITLLAWN